MNKVILLSIFGMLFFSAASQSIKQIDVVDVDGFQYKSYQQSQDSVWGIRYYSRKKSELAFICKIKTNKDILNFEEINEELHNLVSGEIPKIKCGIRSIKFGFVYTNDLYDEVRIVNSDYQVRNIKKFQKNINKIIKKISIEPEKRDCFCLFEITLSVVGNCNTIREKIELKYKE